MDKYLPKEFKDRPYQICRTNEICAKLSTFDTRLCQERIVEFFNYILKNTA
jgi:hypothetical protein